MSSISTAQRLFPARPRPPVWLLDVAIAAAAFAGTLAMLSHAGGFPALPASHELDSASVMLAAACTLPLLAWRRFPMAVFAATAAVSVLLAGMDYPVGLIPGPIAALYLLVAHRPRQSRFIGWNTAAVIGICALGLAAITVAQASFPLHTVLAWAVAWFAGERTRLRREQFADLRERATRAERDTERERLLAVAEERARIARDLHDSAAHAISVIAVRAGAARLRHHQDPSRSLHALQAVEELARQTVAEIDQIVGSLREGEAAGPQVDAPAGLASLDTLVAQHVAAGLKVTVDRTGAPPPLSAAVDQAAYRIIQEALTNALRHGTGSARVRLAFTDTGLDINVSNPVLASVAARPAGGHGLIGMRERATLTGGTLDSQRVNGVFRLRSHLPYTGQLT